MKPLATVVATLVLFTLSASCPAATILYNVDFEGTSNLGHQLRVAGTVTFDSILNNITMSSLQFTDQNVTQPLPAVPVRFGIVAPGAAVFHWLSTPTELRFVVDSQGAGPGSPQAGYDWNGNTIPANQVNFRLSTFNLGVRLSTFAGATDVAEIHDNAPGPPGFLFATAVPEPSTLVLAAFGVLGLLIAARRKR